MLSFSQLNARWDRYRPNKVTFHLCKRIVGCRFYRRVYLSVYIVPLKSSNVTTLSATTILNPRKLEPAQDAMWYHRISKIEWKLSILNVSGYWMISLFSEQGRVIMWDTVSGFKLISVWINGYLLILNTLCGTDNWNNRINMVWVLVLLWYIQCVSNRENIALIFSRNSEANA